MTDQFSEAYIAYILSDEAKGLQKGHLGYEEQQCRFEGAGTDKVAVWLPTLWRLLQIIELAGWEWQRRSNHQWRAYKKGEPLNCLVLDDVGDDVLAAAKLAVRALTNRTPEEA